MNDVEQRKGSSNESQNRHQTESPSEFIFTERDIDSFGFELMVSQAK